MEVAPPSSVVVMGIVKVRRGSPFSSTVTACVPPSATVYESSVNCTVISGATSTDICRHKHSTKINAVRQETPWKERAGFVAG